MTRKRQDRRATRPAVLGLLGLVCLLAGVLMVAAAVVGQVPDPPRPASSFLTRTSAAGHGDHGARGTGLARDDDGSTDAAARTGGAEAADTPEATDPAADEPPSTRDEPEGTPDPSAAALAASEPVAIRVPDLDVDSALHPLGLAEDGTLEVPSGELVDQAAWYSGSPTPGEPGPSVIEGHVTGPGGRPSVFFELAALVPDDRVEVDRADGGTVVFEVYRVDSYPKDDFPTVAVYGPSPGPELRLITCGGEFDEATGHHVDNTVVSARMVDDDTP